MRLAEQTNAVENQGSLIQIEILISIIQLFQPRQCFVKYYFDYRRMFQHQLTIKRIKMQGYEKQAISRE